MKRPRAPLAGLLAPLVALAACGCAREERVVWRREPAATRIEQPAVAPLIEASVPVARVRIAGREALAIVDTGAEGTLVDRAFARGAGLPVRRLASPIGLTRGRARVVALEESAEIAALEIGGFVVEGLLAPLFDMALLSDGVEGVERVDALLGMNAFAGHALLLDGAAGELEVVATGEVVACLARRYAAGSRFDRIELAPGAVLPRVELNLESGALLPALVDTGATGVSLTPAALAELGGEPLGETDVRHVGGFEREPYWHLESLSLGSTVFRDFNVGVHEDEALLGWSLFHRGVLVVDLPDRALWFAHEPAPREPR
jgi:predicted aspartyl protease